MNLDAPWNVRPILGSMLQQFWGENNTPLLRREIRSAVEKTLAGMNLPTKFEVIVVASQKDVDQNNLDVIVRERSAVDRLGELSDG